MQFDRDSLLELSNEFEKKAEEFLEVAERIRNAASLFVGDAKEEQKEEVEHVEEESKPKSTEEKSFTPLEQAIVDSLTNRVAGREILSIVNYCAHNVGMGTHNSIRLSCQKLTNRGILVRLQRGRYSLSEHMKRKIENGQYDNTIANRDESSV